MAFTGTVWTGAGATVTLNSVALTHGLGEVSVTETPTFRDVLNCQNAPYPKKQFVMKKAELTINLKQLDSALAFPDVSDETQTLAITSTGLAFSGNVIITSVDYKFNENSEEAASGTIKCETVDASYTLAKS